MRSHVIRKAKTGGNCPGTWSRAHPWPPVSVQVWECGTCGRIATGRRPPSSHKPKKR